MKRSTIIKSFLVVAVFGASLAACSRSHDVPTPAPPRPKTELHEVITAQLVLHARPLPAPPGWM